MSSAEAINTQAKRMTMFFAIFITILVTGCWYIGWRLINPIGLAPGWHASAWAALLLCVAMMMMPFLLRVRGMETPATGLLTWNGYLIFSLLSTVILLLILRDATWLLVLAGKKIANAAQTGNSFAVPFDAERRRFLIIASNVAVGGVTALFCGLGMAQARSRARVEEVDVVIPGLHKDLEGLRIVQFSDLHVGATIRHDFVARVVDQIRELQADLIVCTGDLFDGNGHSLARDLEPLAKLEAPLGKYFVTGNHEYYVGVDSCLQAVTRLGYTPLLNEHRILSHHGGKLVLAGVTDYRAASIAGETHATDPARALAGAPQELPSLLLAHQPASIYAASELGYSMMLCGHTHGGQYYPWPPVVAAFQPYISGLHKHENTWIYVNRGTGYWGPPNRLGVPAEITLIRLRRDPLAS